MVYTKEKFRELWSMENCHLTYEDVADCAKDWSISRNPRICRMQDILYQVLVAAEVPDAEDYNPYHDNDDD